MTVVDFGLPKIFEASRSAGFNFLELTSASAPEECFVVGAAFLAAFGMLSAFPVSDFIMLTDDQK